MTWANSNTAVFYYEVQVSRDYEFGPNAFLYSEYVHGGASTPPNSYVVPEAFPLEAGEIYYWRVRPRIQGDGDPLPWSATYVFLAPRLGRRLADEQTSRRADEQTSRRALSVVAARGHDDALPPARHCPDQHLNRGV